MFTREGLMWSSLDLMRHLSDTHFKDRMCDGITDQEGLIYKCPQCNHIARDRQSFVRHYGRVHKMVIKYLEWNGYSLDGRWNSKQLCPTVSYNNTQTVYSQWLIFSTWIHRTNGKSQTPQWSPAYQPSEVHFPTLILRRPILHRSIHLPSMSANHQELILDPHKI